MLAKHAKSIRRQSIPISLVVLIVLILSARAASAQVTVTFDEYGNATAQRPGGPILTVPYLGNITDPIDPGNGLKPIAYNLAALTSAPQTDGDINLLEPQNPTTGASDLLRWTHGLLLVYSDLPEANDPNPSPADVGIPVLRQQNVITLTETGIEGGTNGLFGYTPVIALPGAYPTPPGPVTYNFFSDGTVPEPTPAAVLIGVGGAALLRRRRRQNRHRQAYAKDPAPLRSPDPCGFGLFATASTVAAC